MSIAVTGRAVRVRLKSDLKRVKAKDKDKSFDYNHLRVQFADRGVRHLCLTDKQMEKSIELADSRPECKMPTSWMREVWYEGVVDSTEADVKEAMNRLGLPRLASRYNHLRLNIDGHQLHMLLTDSATRSAFRRAKSVTENLPKVGWVSDMFGDMSVEKEEEQQRASAEESRQVESKSQG